MWTKFQEWWTALKDFLYSLVLTILDGIKDVLIFVFDAFMGIAVTALNGLGSLFDGLNVTNYINAVPPEVKHMMGLIGLDVALVMIVTSIGIRLTLQLIPFTRLGS